MTNILFVCLGNICRSPMAEFVMKDIVRKAGRGADFHIESAGTSNEEYGSPVHHGTRNKLAKVGISVAGKTARCMQRMDYRKFDYIIAMEQRNIAGIKRICGEDTQGKVYRLLDFTNRPGDISDPWYTGDFDATYRDVLAGCEAFWCYLQTRGR